MDQKYYNISYAESPFGTLNQYMTRTYGWMAAGLLVTFATALLTVTTPLFELMFSTGLVFLLSIAEPPGWNACSPPPQRGCSSPMRC